MTKKRWRRSEKGTTIAAEPVADKKCTVTVAEHGEMLFLSQYAFWGTTDRK